jgi:hypothetical protein
MAAPDPVASAASDYAAIRPAAVAAATAGRPLIIAWLSRGDGAPLELVSTAASAPTGPTGADPAPGPPAAASPFAGPVAVPAGAPARRRGKHAAPARTGCCCSLPVPGASRPTAASPA